jgi:hypothetical protein
MRIAWPVNIGSDQQHMARGKYSCTGQLLACWAGKGCKVRLFLGNYTAHSIDLAMHAAIKTGC